MDKGVVFSMDAAYAIFIILLASATIITLLNTSNQTNQQSLYLSRIARDIHDTNMSLNGEINTSKVNWIKVNNCSQSDLVGTHRAVAYNGSGDLKTVKTEVCPK